MTDPRKEKNGYNLVISTEIVLNCCVVVVIYSTPQSHTQYNIQYVYIHI